MALPVNARRLHRLGLVLGLVSAFGTLSACSSCDKDKDNGAAEAKSEGSAEPDPSAIRPFRARWDGGRRFRPHRRTPGGDSLFAVEDSGADSGVIEHDP